MSVKILTGKLLQQFTPYWFLRTGPHYIAVGILVSSCLLACPSKITGRVSTSCIFIWFPEGDGCFRVLRCIEMVSLPSVFICIPSGHNASGGLWLEVSHCLENWSRWKARTISSCEGSKVVSKPLITLWFTPFEAKVAPRNIIFSFIYLRGKGEVAFSRWVKSCLFRPWS